MKLLIYDQTGVSKNRQHLFRKEKRDLFFSNDTYANIFFEPAFPKYGKLPEDYQIVGFDNSPIANEAILPITTIGQQIDKIAKTAMELLICRWMR